MYKRQPWNDSSVRGCKRFLERVAGLTDIMTEEPAAKDMEVKIHKAIKKVSSDIEAMKFNTAIACLMTLINEIYAVGKISKDDLVIFIKLLCPFAPHLCEEIWEKMCIRDSHQRGLHPADEAGCFPVPQVKGYCIV